MVSKYKKNIIGYLLKKGIYNEGIDFLIEILVEQIQQYKAVKRLVKKEGLTVSGNAEGSLKVRNQHLKTSQETIDSILKISKTLALDLKNVNEIINDEDEFEALK